MYIGIYVVLFFFFLMLVRPPRSTQGRSSAASDVYKRQAIMLPIDKKFKFKFGEKSFQKHFSEFTKKKIPVQVYYSESLYYDLDTVEDIIRVLTIKPNNKTYFLLKDILSPDIIYSNLVDK